MGALRARAGGMMIVGGAVVPLLLASLAGGTPGLTPDFASRGYVVEWRRSIGFVGTFLLDGVEVSRADCRAAHEECREVVEVAWVVRKVEPDPFDPNLPKVCASVVVAGEVMVVGRNRWCDELGLGASAAHSAQLAVPLTAGRQPLVASLRLDRIAASGGALQSLGVVEGSWLLGGSFRRWLAGVTGLAVPATTGLVVGVAVVLALAVVGWWFVRRRAKRRADLAQELARLNEEISAAGGEVPAFDVVSEGEAEPPKTEAPPLELPHVARPIPSSIEVEATPEEVQPSGHSVVRLGARLTDSDGEPTAGVRLRMVADGGPVDRVFADRTTVTDPDGCASLELRVPLMAEVRRLYLTAEVSGGAEGAGTLRARTWVRVRDIALEIHPAQPRVQRGADGGIGLVALLRDDAGVPVAGVELRSEVVDGGGGSMTPETAVTDGEGRAEFYYDAGERAGEIRVRIWPKGEPRLAREVVVEQVD